MKKYSLHSVLLLPVVAGILFFSCKKDISTENSIGTVDNTDLTTKVSTSVSGFVTDENNLPAQGAAVTAGAGSATTDQFGYFEIKNVQLVKNAAFVIVNKTGYFKGIKTWTATENHTAFFRIKLLPKTNAGSVSGSAGGDITLTGGMQVSFPAAAFVNAATGAAYTGSVTVSAQWLNPLATDLSSTMPGDLRGKDASGALQLLTTYGMAVVELTGSSSELLQIAPGKKATLTMPIPVSMAAAAPASIPLWYFDETNGLWKEEGTATKTGNNYVGDVSHFTFWNCDAPSGIVHFDLTVVDVNGNPVQYPYVQISFVNNPNIVRGAYADISGYIGGSIPKNTALKLEIFSNALCGTAVYSQLFTTATSDISFGNINIGNILHTLSVSGTVTNCAGNPVYPGHVIFLLDNYYYSVPLNTNGSYSFSGVSCNLPQACQIIAIDSSNAQQSTPVTFTVNLGNNIIPAVAVCGISTLEFFNYTINSNSYYFTGPADYLSLYPYGYNPPQYMGLYGSRSNTGEYSSANFSYAGIGPGSTQQLAELHLFEHPDSIVISTPVDVHITEYGATGQYISGNFSGIFSSYPTPAPTVINGSFRVKRNY